MEPTLSIKAFTHNGLPPAVKPLPRLRPRLRKIPELPTVPEKECDSKPRRLNKLSDILDEECDIFEPFGSNYPLSSHTLLCFLFEEESGPFVKDDTPLSWFPPSRFPSPTFISLSKPPKNLPPSTGINHLEDQIKCILHYEDLIDEVCNDQLPIHQIQQRQLPKELSLAEMLANELRKTLAQREILKQKILAHQEDAYTDKLMKGPVDMKRRLKRFLSLPALKQRMSGSVRK